METTPTTRIPAWGADKDPSRRPGVPMEIGPEPRPGAHWERPDRQDPPRAPVLTRVGLKELTPVYSDAIPPKGVSGLLRRAAYRIPETQVRHWMLLLLADRVDVVEHRRLQLAGLLGVGLVLWRALGGRR